MAIERIGNVFFRVADMDAAVDFYQRVLGLTLKFRDGDRWTAFDVGGLTFALEGAADPPEGRGGAIPSFRVQDLDEFVSQLRERGASVGEISQGAHERRLELRDPAGNLLVLYEPLPRP